METDHKPLVLIFQKSLHSAPKRLQRMLLRLQKYNLHVKYLPGSQMYIADMLSRAYLQADHSQHGNIPEYQIFHFSQEKLLFQEIADINQADYMRLLQGTHQQIMNMIMTGWPRGSSSLYPRVLELQRIVNSSRWSLVQRNESDCPCFYETSDDCKS